MVTRKAILLNTTLAVTMPKAMGEVAGIKKGTPCRVSFVQPDLIVIQAMILPSEIDEKVIREAIKKEERTDVA